MATGNSADSNVMSLRDYLGIVGRRADKPAFWSADVLAAALQRLPREERGAIVLTSGARGDHGEIAPGLSLVLQEVKSGQHTSPHRHSFWHVYIVQGGKGYARIEGLEDGRPIAAGDIIFVPPFHSHGFDNPEGTEPLVLVTLQNMPQLAQLGCFMRENEAGSWHLVRTPDETDTTRIEGNLGPC